MSTFARLIDTGDLDGPRNMAIDELLWRQAADGVPVLRLYRWADCPTVSLGYFQSSAGLDRQPLWRGIRYVRRMTGGGAIVHDQDLTYALALPASLEPSSEKLYWRIHRAIAAALGRRGIAATIGEMPQRVGTDFLCFHRGDRFAVCVRGHKILGSAQRRRRGAVLMHGSLLLRASALARELPGLQDLTARHISCEDLARVIIHAAVTGLDLWFHPCQLDKSVASKAERLAREKYSSGRWNDRRK